MPVYCIVLLCLAERSKRAGTVCRNFVSVGLVIVLSIVLAVVRSLPLATAESSSIIIRCFASNRLRCGRNVAASKVIDEPCRSAGSLRPFFLLVFVVIAVLTVQRFTVLLPYDLPLLLSVVVLIRIDRNAAVFLIIFRFLASVSVVEEIGTAGTLEDLPVAAAGSVLVIVVVVTLAEGRFLLLVHALRLVFAIKTCISGFCTL